MLDKRKADLLLRKGVGYPLVCPFTLPMFPEELELQTATLEEVELDLGISLEPPIFY